MCVNRLELLPLRTEKKYKCSTRRVETEPARWGQNVARSRSNVNRNFAKIFETGTRSDDRACKTRENRECIFLPPRTSTVLVPLFTCDLTCGYGAGNQNAMVRAHFRMSSRSTRGPWETHPECDPTHWWHEPYVTAMQRWLGRSVCERLGIYRLPEGFVLSVIVPVYNEVATIDAVITRLRETSLPMQIVLVDDGSDDGTSERLSRYRDASDVVSIRHAHNQGKGAAIRSGITVATGEVLVVQDADQEYHPDDFRALLQPIVAGEADVAYGSRYGHFHGQVSPWWHRAANGLLTLLTNLVIGLCLHDVETCYKMARREHFQAVVDELQETRFGIEIELTARWARRGLRFTERPIRYRPRWYEAGKKIGMLDGLRALWCIVKYGLLRR